MNDRIRLETGEVTEPTRPGRWSSTEWRVFLTVAVLLLVNVSLFGPAADSVSRNMAEATMSMVEERNLDIDEYVEGMVPGGPNLVDKAERDGHIYSGSGPGVSFLMVPVHIALKPVLWLLPGQLAGASRQQMQLTMLLSTSGVLAAIVCALAAVVIYRWTQLMGTSPAVSLAAALAWIPGSWAFYYGTHVSTKTLSAALMLFACYHCARALGRPAKPSGHPTTRLLLAGLLVSTAVAVDYAPLWVAIVLGIYVLHQGGLKAAVWYAFGTLPMSVLTGLYQTLAFGGPFDVSYASHMINHSSPPAVTWPDLQRVYGLTFSPFKGMFFYAPWAVLSLVGCVQGLRTRFRPEVILGSAIVLTTCGFNLSLDVWTGYGWGPRYLTMTLPFLALMLAFVPRRCRVLLWTLVALGVLLNLLPVLHGGIVIGEKPWDNPITLYGGAILETGAATYALRFFSRNVRELTPATLTALQALLTMLTALLVWFIWKKREPKARRSV